MPLKRLSLLFLTLFFRYIASADTFIVTSNSDSGPGTLREAITSANTNGTAVTDNIVFNIVDLSESGRTITLQSKLPALSSNIVIDGSTQPGSKFSISDAKIALYLDHYIEYSFTFLVIQSATNVKIFGLFFKVEDVSYISGDYGIRMIQSSIITIGEPGKGNLFSGVTMAISNNYYNIYYDSVNNLKIQGNIFGLRRTGYRMGGSIYLKQAHNVEIGGDQPEKGNIFTSSWIDIGQSAYPNPDFFAIIQHNRFNFDGLNYTNDRGDISLAGNITDSIGGPPKTIIKNNLLSSSNWNSGIYLVWVRHTAIIQGNKLGTDVTGQSCRGTNNNIFITQCSNVIIGGYLPEEENIIADYLYIPAHGTHIIKNKIHEQIITNGVAPNDPFIKILTYDAGIITGIANPNAKIQLYTDQCHTTCPAKVYHETIYADATGNWSFPYLDSMPNLVATSTIGDSSTSPFTAPLVDHFNYRIITHATCGRNNGSITGIRVYNGTHIRWYNGLNKQLVGTDTNLVNVPAGPYYLTVSNGENGCTWSSNFTIENLEPLPVISRSIYDATCGQNNGKIITSNFSYGSKWLNQNYDSLGTGYFINNLAPGTYYLKVWISYDTSCNKTYGPFIVNNLTGASLDINNAQIMAATCENANGSITGITANNVNGLANIRWLDSLNNIVGSSLDLQNIPAGKYRIKFKDEGSCDTITTPFFVVGANGAITIDTSGKLVTASGCTIANGNIQNILVTGAGNLLWKNTINGANMGNTPAIFNLPAGSYELTASNMIGCSKSIKIVVPQTGFSPIGVRDLQSRDAVCGENNGLIRIVSFNNNASLYTFRWIDSASSQLIATGTEALNLGPGTYYVVATDTNGCEQQILKSSISAFPQPIINYGQMLITNDNCSLQNAAVSGISVNSIYGPTIYRWVNSSNDTVGTTLNLMNIGAGAYKLIVTDSGICRVESNWISVSNTDINPGGSVYNEYIILRNSSANISPQNPEQATYSLFANVTSPAPAQQNSTGQFNIGPIANDTIVYVQKVKGSCVSGMTPVIIKVVDKSFFVIPSAFTPNNDGLNDRLNLKIIGLIDVEYFRIFNRNGEMVFSTKTINTGWDGNINGIQQSTGVYIWIAKGKDINGNSIKAKGTFVLIR